MTKINIYAFPGIKDVDLPDELIRKRISALRETPNGVTHAMVAEAVEEVFRLSYSKFKSDRRDRPLVDARMVYSYYMRTYTKWSLKEIGISLGRDHSSVSCSIEAYHTRCFVDKKFEIMSHRVAMVILRKSFSASQLEVSLPQSS